MTDAGMAAAGIVRPGFVVVAMAGRVHAAARKVIVTAHLMAPRLCRRRVLIVLHRQGCGG